MCMCGCGCVYVGGCMCGFCPSHMAALDQGCNCKPCAAADKVDQGKDEVLLREGWSIVVVGRVVSLGLGGSGERERGGGGV